MDGIDLNTHINARGRLDPQEAWLITVQAARALDHAFQQGITHRDVKPSNFLLARQGRKLRVKLTDLGVARAIRDEDFRVTRAGTTVGTLDYLAPEQARDSALADVRSDIYSLGCTLYHMLAGQPPFPDGGLGERLFKHMQVEPPDVRQFNADVPDGLWAVLRRMLAKRPDQRYQTPAELLDALIRLGAPRGAGPGPDRPDPVAGGFRAGRPAAAGAGEHARAARAARAPATRCRRPPAGPGGGRNPGRQRRATPGGGQAVRAPARSSPPRIRRRATPTSCCSAAASSTPRTSPAAASCASWGRNCTSDRGSGAGCRR